MIQQNLIAIVAEALQLDENIVQDNSSLQDLPNWCSLAHMELIFKVEKHFDVRFEGSEIINMKTVTDISNILEEKLCHV